MEMVDGVIKGKFAKRGIWTKEDGYLVLMPDIKLIWKIITTPMPNAGGYPFTIDDILADDWVLSDPCHDSDAVVKYLSLQALQAAA